LAERNHDFNGLADDNRRPTGVFPRNAGQLSGRFELIALKGGD